jgi:hypothetical protein
VRGHGLRGRLLHDGRGVGRRYARELEPQQDVSFDGFFFALLLVQHVPLLDGCSLRGFNVLGRYNKFALS